MILFVILFIILNPSRNGAEHCLDCLDPMSQPHAPCMAANTAVA